MADIELAAYLAGLAAGTPNESNDHIYYRKADGSEGKTTAAAINSLLALKTVNGNDLRGAGDIVISGGGASGTGSYFFDGGHVNCGHFWKSGVTYGDFFWEAWIKPINASTNGYLVSDGYGGDHNLLWGINTSTTKATMISKYYDGSPDYTEPVEGFPLNEWAHIATSWNGSTLKQYINGMLSGKWAEATARNIPANHAVNGVLFIGGSDHSNISAHIAQLRGFEGTDAVSRGLRWNLSGDIYAERYFRPRIWRISDETFYESEFCMNMMFPGTAFTDISAGFDDTVTAGGRRLHHGVFGGGNSSGYSKESVVFKSNNYPNWVPGDIITPTYADTPPATPVGAKVFDSFSRADKTMVFYNDGENRVGSTESGSLGPLVWSNQQWCIRDGRLAYPYNLIDYIWVDAAGTADAEIRVSRIPNDYCHTGIILRFVDSSNYVFIKAYPNQIETRTMIGGVNTALDIDSGFATNWTELKAVFSGTTLNVYKDGVLLQGPLTIPASAATKHGCFAPDTGGGINRFDNFTIL